VIADAAVNDLPFSEIKESTRSMFPEDIVSPTDDEIEAKPWIGTGMIGLRSRWRRGSRSAKGLSLVIPTHLADHPGSSSPNLGATSSCPYTKWGAAELQIWKQVDRIFIVDPRQVPTVPIDARDQPRRCGRVGARRFVHHGAGHATENPKNVDNAQRSRIIHPDADPSTLEDRPDECPEDYRVPQFQQSLPLLSAKRKMLTPLSHPGAVFRHNACNITFVSVAGCRKRMSACGNLLSIDYLVPETEGDKYRLVTVSKFSESRYQHARSPITPTAEHIAFVCCEPRIDSLLCRTLFRGHPSSWFSSSSNASTS
jgi:hypothetical protein